MRITLRTYYDYRISTVQVQLDGLEKQRSATIEKLKVATRYDSTQELLKKYGGASTPKEKFARKPEAKTPTYQGKAATPQGGRTNIAPPPTANIPGRVQIPSPQETPQPFPQQGLHSQPRSPQSRQRPLSPQDTRESFALNAFPSPPQYAQMNEGPRWYDRLIDVLMGEDESLPGKRLALICKECRLVNGQAPPGVKRIEDVGKWRCAGCSTMNGEESEVAKLVARIQDDVPKEAVPHEASLKAGKKAESNYEEHESDITQYSSEEERSEKPAVEAETPRRRSTRVRKQTRNEE